MHTRGILSTSTVCTDLSATRSATTRHGATHHTKHIDLIYVYMRGLMGSGCIRCGNSRWRQQSCIPTKPSTPPPWRCDDTPAHVARGPTTMRMVCVGAPSPWTYSQPLSPTPLPPTRVSLVAVCCSNFILWGLPPRCLALSQGRKARIPPTNTTATRDRELLLHR